MLFTVSCAGVPSFLLLGQPFVHESSIACVRVRVWWGCCVPTAVLPLSMKHTDLGRGKCLETSVSSPVSASGQTGSYLVPIQEGVHEPRTGVFWWGGRKAGQPGLQGPS